MENFIMVIIAIIITFAIGAFFHWLNTKTIMKSMKTITESTERVMKEFRIDIDGVLKAIVTNGEQTRKAIQESSERAIRAIQESHRILKEELRK